MLKVKLTLIFEDTVLRSHKIKCIYPSLGTVTSVSMVKLELVMRMQYDRWRFQLPGWDYKIATFQMEVIYSVMTGTTSMNNL